MGLMGPDHRNKLPYKAVRLTVAYERESQKNLIDSLAIQYCESIGLLNFIIQEKNFNKTYIRDYK